MEFIKELLKPTWKEGQMSKDAYKNIVKKVVDKVTGTMQGATIPQTQEKIQQYLSFSKPKLTKLVQVCSHLLGLCCISQKMIIQSQIGPFFSPFNSIAAITCICSWYKFIVR